MLHLVGFLKFQLASFSLSSILVVSLFNRVNFESDSISVSHRLRGDAWEEVFHKVWLSMCVTLPAQTVAMTHRMGGSENHLLTSPLTLTLYNYKHCVFTSFTSEHSSILKIQYLILSLSTKPNSYEAESSKEALHPKTWGLTCLEK